MNCCLNVICVPSERMMGLRSTVLFDSFRFGMKRTSVFDFLEAVPVCICNPNRFRWFRVRFAVLVASSRVRRMKALLST